jgi:hypothetical protein
MHTTPTGSEEEAEEKEQKKEEQKRLAEEDIIMKSRLLSNAFKCLSPGQTRHMSSSLGNSIQSAIDIAKESEAGSFKKCTKNDLLLRVVLPIRTQSDVSVRTTPRFPLVRMG